MKILVTGGLGFIGSHTVVELQNEGFEVVVVDNLSNSSIDVLNGIEAITGKKLIFEEFDLREKSKVQAFFENHKDVVGVIHFAASKAVGESVEEPLLYYENNLGVLVYILQELKKKGGASFIFSSSCTVYGQADKTCRIPLWQYQTGGRGNYKGHLQGTSRDQSHCPTLF